MGDMGEITIGTSAVANLPRRFVKVDVLQGLFSP